MKFLPPPKTSYDNHYDRARFDVAWRVNRFMAFVNIPLIVAMYFISPFGFYSAIGGWIVPVMVLLGLWKLRKFRVISWIYVFLGTASISTLFFHDEIHFHLVNMAFMMMVGLYAFITLGKFAGILSYSVYVISAVTYFSTQFNADLAVFDGLSDMNIAVASFNMVIAFTIMSYMMSEFLKLSKHAEQNYIRANEKLKTYNREIKSRDEEKTVMLKEIHHRVKNNLQVIISLLRLQSNEITDGKSKLKYDDAVNRITAMSLIHQKMYTNKKIGDLYLDEYLEDLSKQLINSYAMTKPVEVEVDSISLSLGNQTIVPLALIFNELISNSLKHAFDGVDEGRIEVLLTEIDDGRLSLCYSDNGSWKEPENETTFGLELINTLVEQLQGEMVREVDNGTTYRIKMSVLD